MSMNLFIPIVTEDKQHKNFVSIISLLKSSKQLLIQAFGKYTFMLCLKN